MMPHPSTIDAVAALRREDLLVHARRQRIAAGADDRAPRAPITRGAGATFVQAVALVRPLILAAVSKLDSPRAAARGGHGL